MIEYRKGDCLQKSEEARIIAHVCNNKGGFGKGFALSLADKYPIAVEVYKRTWFYDGLDLGTTQFAESGHTIIANMVCQDGYRSKKNPVALRYDALEECLKEVRRYNDLKLPIWMPKIGTGLAGGDWSKIEPLINKHLSKLSVIIFEL